MTPEEEAAHARQEHAREVDLMVWRTLETFRALGDDDGIVLAGACTALARYTANSLQRQQPNVSVLVRDINADLFKRINTAAERVLAGPSREVPDPPAKGPEGGAKP